MERHCPDCSSRLSIAAQVPDTLTEAFARYAELTRPHRCVPDSAPGLLGELRVSVADPSEAPPQQGTAEEYNITVPATGAATLRAATIYGAMRGMESFSQLVQFNFSTSSYHIAHVPLQISDAPRFVRTALVASLHRSSVLAMDAWADYCYSGSARHTRCFRCIAVSQLVAALLSAPLNVHIQLTLQCRICRAFVNQASW